MLAAVLLEQENLCPLEIATPAPEPGGLLIRIEACGICRTDMKAYYLGQRDVRLPRVLGHEIVGQVVEDRTLASKYLGKRVQISPGLACGVCRYCLAGQDNLCPQMQILGFHRDGGFAEYIALPATGVANKIVNPLKKTTDSAIATLTEPLACAINMLDKMRLRPGDSLLVLGCGTLGLLTALLGQHRGLEVVVSEINHDRRQKAAHLLGCRVLDGTGRELLTDIAAAMPDGGFAGVIPCAPGGQPFLDGIEATRKGGVLGFFSGLIAGEEYALARTNLAHYKELRIIGAYGCTVRHCRQALRLIEGPLSLAPLVTHRLPLSELTRGIHMVRDGAGLKTVIEMAAPPAKTAAPTSNDIKF